MAKNQTVLPRIGNFYPSWFAGSWLIFLFMELVAVIVTVALFWIVVIICGLTAAMMSTVVVLVLLESAIGYFFLRRVLRPVDYIARALIQIAGENSILPPPDRNDPKIQKSGLAVIINTIYDINARHAQLPDDNNEKVFDNLLNALPIGMIALNDKREIIAANDLAPTCLDQENRRHVQLDFSDSNDSLEMWLDQVSEKEINAEKIWTHIQNVTPDSTGERRIFDVVAHYKKNAASGIETMIVTVDRTTDYEVDETNLDFIALAAHELRSPITVIRGYLDILDGQLGDRLTREQRDLMDRLNVSAKRLSSYIGNILNVSRYDRRHLKLTLHETLIENIIDDIKNDMELRARTLDRRLVWQIPHELPTVAADRSSVSEVLSNLIDNAIKYSHDGGQIEIGASADAQFVTISVRDYGIGIPPAVADHLFSKFYRSHRSRGAIGGTGLGLYISRAIIESHGGHIGVQSTEGQGSTFTFTLPIFATVADQLAVDDSNLKLIRKGGNWIRNHSRIQH